MYLHDDEDWVFHESLEYLAEVEVMGFGVWGLRVGVCGLGFVGWGLGFRV